MPVKALPPEFFYNDTWVDVSRGTTITIEDIDRAVAHLESIGVPAYRGEYLGICFPSELGHKFVADLLDGKASVAKTRRTPRNA